MEQQFNSIIPEANRIYSYLFGKQLQGKKTNMTLCDLICFQIKKNGDSLKPEALLSSLCAFLRSPGKLDWIAKAILGDEAYERLQTGKGISVTCDTDTGKASFIVESETLHEIDTTVKVASGASLKELQDKYLPLGTPTMYEGLTDDNAKLLSIMGRCAEVGLL